MMETSTDADLRAASFAIKQRPYHPESFLRRAHILAELAYPELAAGDAHKTVLLCQAHSRRPQPSYRVGHACGFLMRDTTAEQTHIDGECQALLRSLETIESQAYRLLYEQASSAGPGLEGRYIPAQYPWMRAEARSDALIGTMNDEFEAIRSPCKVKRYAFGYGAGPRNGADLLGVFAKRDIAANEEIVIDTSQIWGCNGAGLKGNETLYGGQGCTEPHHPNDENDDHKHDLRWIRDESGKTASGTIAKCRLLLKCVKDGVDSPLNHTLVDRLTPTYDGNPKRFIYDADIVVPNKALQQFGIDIFANERYDTWVLFTIFARVDNNAWSNSLCTAVNSLFSLFNHSCEPNVSWGAGKEDHKTVLMCAKTDVKKDEQLFIEYDQYLHSEPLKKRRNVLRRWLVMDCQCSRCLREETEHAMDSGTENAWDTEVRPTLPEDEGMNIIND